MTLAYTVIEKRNPPTSATIVNTFTKKTWTQSLWSFAISINIGAY